MLYNEETLAYRRPVWKAISELWLDTELSDFGYKQIALVFSESPYDLADLECIAFEEVAPILYLNFYTPAGAWDGFDPVWLEEQIIKRSRKKVTKTLDKLLYAFYKNHIKSQWQRALEEFSVQKISD